ncbi:MAG TPA: Ig-like domain-containing protein, partial [Actinomycetota bacterium]
VVSAAAFSARTDAQGRFELRNIPAGADNMPTQVFVTASATGFISQQKVVTVYCGASIAIDFGARTTQTSTIVGTVTNLDTGHPIAGAFVGGEHGGTATTDAAGNYTLPNVPLGDLEADREWDVTAVVPGFRPKTVAVVARAGQTVRADIGLTTAGNSRPVADALSVSTPEDRGISPLTLTGSDADGDPLSYHVLVPPAHGRLRGVAPSLEYSPDQHYHGTDELEFVTFDGQDYSEPARISIQVDSVNDPPFLAFDEVTRPAGVPARIPVSLVLANDVDVDGDTLTVTAASGSFGATATLDGDDIVVSRLGAGDAYVSYSVTDGTVTTSATLLVHFVVMPVAPVCADASFAGVEDEPVAGQLACSDANGDALTYSVATPPAVGTLTLQPGGSFTYTPPAGLTGPVTFRFRASDGALTSDEATATIAIAPANAAPVCADQAFATDEDTVLAAHIGCADADGDELSYALVRPPATGVLVLLGDGSFEYEPAPGASGPVTFEFRASDGAAVSLPATGTIDVRPVNDAPVAGPREVDTDEDVPVPVTLDASDADGDPLTLTWTEPAHGSYDGATYTPAANFHGTDSFTYTADDGNGGTATAEIRVVVRPVNDAPAAPDVSAETAEDTAVTIELAGADVDGDPLTTTFTQPAHGSFDGTAYTPDRDYHGADSFTYTVTDPTGASATGSVALTVRPVNDAPVVADRSLTTDEDGPVRVELAAVDADGDDVLFAWTQPAHGAYDGETYVPAADFHGTDAFTFTADDGNGGSATATVNVTVRPVNDAPTAPDLTVETAEDTPVTVELRGADVDGDELTVTSTAPALGDFDGATYTPGRDYHGPDAFTYTVTDPAGATATGTVTVTVHPVNDAPVAADATLTTDEDTPVPFTPTATDVDGDTLTTTWTQPAHGSYDGTAYTPVADYNGTDTFAFTAS